MLLAYRAGSMTITISKTALLSKLQLLSKIIPAKSTTPIFGYFLFEMKGGRLFLTASNEEGRITTSLECLSDVEGAICMPTTIVDGLKSLSEQPIDIFVDLVVRNVKIKYHGGKFEFAGYDPSTYPIRKEIQALDRIQIKANAFYTGIAKVLSFAAVDDLRPILTSVFIEACPGSVYFVGTDGHGLGYVRRDSDVQISPISLVLSRSMASVLKSILPTTEEEMEIGIGGDWSEIAFNDYDISFRNQEGRYPNWKTVIPQANNLRLAVDTKLLLSAIKRTLVFSDKLSCLILLKILDDKLTVLAQNLDYSTSAEETLSVEFTGGQFTIGVKGSILQEMLACVDADRSVLTFSEPNRAILITPETQSAGQELTYLLMPMTIQ